MPNDGRWPGAPFAVVLASLAALSVTPAAAAGPVALEISAWRLSLPDPSFADLPALVPEIDYSEANTLQSLVFVCDADSYFALVVGPLFEAPPTGKGTLALGSDKGPAMTLALRDLYSAPGADAPKLDWDSAIYYAPVDMEDLSTMASVDQLALSFAGQTWRLPLPDFDRAMPAFLEYCATGKVSDRGIVLE